MENERNHQCRKCGGIGTPSKALVNYHFIDKSYLRGEKEFVDKLVDCIKCQSCGHSWIPVNTSIFGNSNKEIIEFPIEGKSTRQQAIAWWNSLTLFQRSYFKDLHFDSQRSLSTLTGREIEDIWLKETAEKGITITDISKQNQKQFKKFDESLFRAYINKFSDEDKVAALRVLFKSIGITSKDKLEYFLARY